MARQLARHGSRSGYRAGCHANSHCPARPTCTEANRNYEKNRQASKGRVRVTAGRTLSGQASTLAEAARAPRSQDASTPSTPLDSGQPEPARATRPNWTDRIMGIKFPEGGQVIETDDPPDYLHPVELDAEPGDGEWTPIADGSSFVITEDLKADIRGSLGMYAGIIGAPLDLMDAYCGAAYSENIGNMINKLTPIICRSPRAIKFFESTTGPWMEWLMFLQACWPLAQAIYMHHLAKTVRTTPDGRVMRIHKDGLPDATMPPQPVDDFQYTAS